MSVVRITTADILLFYFDESTVKYALTASMIGSAVGWSVYPSLIQYLMDTYGYSMAMYIIGAVVTTLILAGLAYVETDKMAKSSDTSEEQQLLDKPRLSKLEILKKDFNAIKGNVKVRYIIDLGVLMSLNSHVAH